MKHIFSALGPAQESEFSAAVPRSEAVSLRDPVVPVTDGFLG
jgi:hypothetical protein